MNRQGKGTRVDKPFHLHPKAPPSKAGTFHLPSTSLLVSRKVCLGISSGLYTWLWGPRGRITRRKELNPTPAVEDGVRRWSSSPRKQSSLLYSHLCSLDCWECFHIRKTVSQCLLSGLQGSTLPMAEWLKNRLHP